MGVGVDENGISVGRLLIRGFWDGICIGFDGDKSTSETGA